MSLVLKTNWKSPFLALSVHRRYELAATYEVYCSSPTIDDAPTSAQIFTVYITLLNDAYGMESDKKFTSMISDDVH